MARRGEEAVREEAARKGPAVEAAVAAVKRVEPARLGGMWFGAETDRGGANRTRRAAGGVTVDHEH